MITIPHEQEEDYFNVLISLRMDVAKVKILKPLNLWILIKLAISVYVSYQKIFDGFVAVTLMDYYVCYFPIYTTLFAILPEILIMFIESSSVEANVLTKRIQCFQDVGVCIFGVSLFFLFYFEFLPPWDGTPGVGGGCNSDFITF